MRTESIAQRFAKRRDFALVDVAMVALPMYAITMELVCLAHRPFPPMALYILRTVHAGLTREAEIAGFLGVEVSVVNKVLEELVEGRYVSRGDESRAYELLEQGVRVIEMEKEFVPQEETHTVIFDGILRRPIWISGERLLRPSEIDRVSTIEIRPYPGVPPEREELKLADVVSVLKSQYGADEFDRDVLALSRIARRSKVFRLAIGLAYKMKKGPEIQVAFVVDGVPHSELEQVFAEKGGARKMGFMKALSEVGIERAVRRHLGSDVVQLMPDETELRARMAALSDARLDFDIAVRRAESEPRETNVAGLREARLRFEEATLSIQTYPVRPLDVYEVGDLLEDALSSAASRVLVTVADWENGLSRDLVRRLEIPLKRGVEIRILNIVRAKGDAGERPKSEKFAELDKVLSRYRNFSVATSRRLGFFFLVKDSQFAAISNRPMLGPASRTRMFHQFAGYLLQDSQVVNAYIERLAEAHWNDLKPRSNPRSD